ncbi:MAG: outer membrane protein assembly factor BamD [Proteobacteria bacterium]|nr:outer membrane protein assembly factor BamD [Pseudomonadota bacterium]
MQKFFPILFGIFFILSSCSSIEKIEGADKAETYYLRGVAYLKDSMYIEALEKFNLVKNKFPYSKYAVDAELKIGDTYFQKGDFIEAQRVYSLFAELHPQEPRMDYATYQSGMCFYSALPSAIDRDISYAKKAIDEFKAVMDHYPNSVYLKDAVERYTELRTKLAEKEIYIGDFYKKRDKWEAAAERYKTVIEQYPNLNFDERMYYELANCYKKLDKPEEAKYYIDLLIITYPNSPYVGKAKSLQKGL